MDGLGSRKVKICGVTNTEDARIIADSGADMLGMIVDVPVETPRKMSLDEAEVIGREIGDEINIVVVLCPGSVKEVRAVVRRIDLFGIQLHGFESNAFLKSVRYALRDHSYPDVKLIKTVHVDEDGTVHGIMPEEDYVDFILLDTYTYNIASAQTGRGSGAGAGGTGKKHSWSKSKEIVEDSSIPVILSGGLRPDNVKEAIRVVDPYGVDVASGVEEEEEELESPGVSVDVGVGARKRGGGRGRKSKEKVMEFVRNAKAK